MLLTSTWMLGKTAPASSSQATREKINKSRIAALLLLDVADLSPTVPWSHTIHFLLLGDSCPEMVDTGSESAFVIPGQWRVCSDVS